MLRIGFGYLVGCSLVDPSVMSSGIFSIGGLFNHISFVGTSAVSLLLVQPRRQREIRILPLLGTCPDVVGESGILSVPPWDLFVWQFAESILYVIQRESSFSNLSV